MKKLLVIIIFAVLCFILLLIFITKIESVIPQILIGRWNLDPEMTVKLNKSNPIWSQKSTDHLLQSKSHFDCYITEKTISFKVDGIGTTVSFKVKEVSPSQTILIVNGDELKKDYLIIIKTEDSDTIKIKKDLTDYYAVYNRARQ